MEHNDAYRDLVKRSLTTKMSHRKVARLSGVSHNSVRRIRQEARLLQLDWDDICGLTPIEIGARLGVKKCKSSKKRAPDWHWVSEQMREENATRIEIWERYRRIDPTDAYSYSQFTHHYRVYQKRIDVSMRQHHLPGEKSFVDFTGTTVPWFCELRNERRYAQIFIGVLGYSNYTFVYAVDSQSLPCWIEAHTAMLEFFGGVPQCVVPDNLKAAVTRAGRNPVLNRTYVDQARHYNFIILPARVYKPKDKSKAEYGVLFASRWVLTVLRRQKFFSIAEINAAIGDLLPRLNERPFKRYPGNRRARFLEHDAPVLQPLPEKRYEYGEWCSATSVGKDYHVFLENHAYSVPYRLVGEKVESRLTSKSVQIYHQGRQVALHVRSSVQGGATTDPNHRPLSHQKYAEQDKAHYLGWAKSVGPFSVKLVQAQFTGKRDDALSSCNACSHIRDMAKFYGSERLEAACRRAVEIDSLTVKSVKSILQCRLDQIPFEEEPFQPQLPLHHNVRGPGYYTEDPAHER